MAQLNNAAPLNDIGLPDDNKPLAIVDHPVAGQVALNVEQILQGYGEGKQMITASYTPQSLSSVIENAQFDILVPKSSGNGGVNIVDQIYLQIDITINSYATPSNVALKPLHQWFQRLDITMDGSSVLQSIYFDKSFVDYFNNSTVSNLDDFKSQTNMDPRNGLCWYDDQAISGLLTTNGAGLITATSGTAGASSYLSQPYFESGGDSDGATAGQLYSYEAFAKGGYLRTNSSGYLTKTFYLPIPNTFLQASKILMNKLNGDLRFKFYTNNQIKLYDEGAGANSADIKLNQATLWLVGKKLAPASLAVLNAQYEKPVVSNFNWYLEFIQPMGTMTPGTAYDIVLNPLVGNCLSLTFWLSDDRQDIKYPRASYGGVQYIQNNMMTVPIAKYSFINNDGSVYGSGLAIPNDLTIMMNDFRKFPKNVSGDDRLYFRKYYYLDFTNNPITAENEAIYSGFYPLDGKQRLRIYIPSVSDFPATSFPNKELNAEGNAVDATPSSAMYSNVTLHVVATIQGEMIESNGQLIQRIPRING